VADLQSLEASASTILYSGDHGSLPLDTRLALCKLLSGPFIDADSPHWSAVLRDESILRSRLADVFLDLILDRERRVAFTRQADTDELDTPVLLRSTPLSYIDSVLLLQLRETLIAAETRHERAVIDESELHNHLDIFAGTGVDRVGAHKRIGAAIEKMKKNNILQAIRGSDKRYEVSPALRLLFTANDVEALSKAYRRLANGEPVTISESQENINDAS
jgi:hypothetical protein